jgi:hypothetical protein
MVREDARMRISRIFRKYSRVLLLVFMSLLLVVFLLGDVIGRASRGGQMRDVEIGQAFGEPVFLSQTQRAEDDFNLAAQLMLRTPPVVSEDAQERNLAIYLLMQEARRAGVVVGRERISEALSRVPQSSFLLDRIRQRHKLGLNAIYDSATRIVATMMLAEYQVGALASASLPEVEHAYRDENQEARVLISVIDAKAFLPKIPEPTEAELQSHFEECKDRESAHTDEARVCGYRIPDRVQVEYLTVDPDAIKESIRVSAREAERFYEENRQKYMKEVESPTPFALDDSGAPQKIQMAYEEVVDRVREDCRAAKAIEEAQRLVNDIHHDARLPWAAAPLGEDKLRVPPPADKIVSFEELKAKFSSTYPVTYQKTELVTERELPRVERGFGKAAAVIERQPVRAATLAFHVEGLAAPDPSDHTPILRINEPGPVVIETRTIDKDAGPIPYQAYVFRVVAVAPSGPPASLDDVREQVIQDVKDIKALELAGAQARALAEQARQSGLQEAVAGAEELKSLLRQDDGQEDAQKPASTTQPNPLDPAERFLRALQPFEPEQFLRQPRPLKYVGYAPKLHEMVFAPPDEGGPDPTQEHPVIVVPLARSLKYAVVQLLELKPMYQGEFELKREELERQAYMDRAQEFWQEWFEPKNILARTGYVPNVTPQQ